MFPPSIPLVIFATVAEASVVRLLLAGILPALLMAGALMVTVAILARRLTLFPQLSLWLPARVLGG